MKFLCIRDAPTNAKQNASKFSPCKQFLSPKSNTNMSRKWTRQFHFLFSPANTNLERVHQILHQEESSQLLEDSVDVHQTHFTVLVHQIRRNRDILIQVHPAQRERLHGWVPTNYWASYLESIFWHMCAVLKHWHISAFLKKKKRSSQLEQLNSAALIVFHSSGLKSWQGVRTNRVQT